MLFNKNKIPTFDTLCFTPVTQGAMEKIKIEDGLTIDQLKVDNALTYKIGEDSFPITSKNKTAQEIYDMMAGWDEATLLNAFFSKNLEAGNIGASGFDITKILIKKLDKSTGYKEYVTSGYVDFKNGTTMTAKDYLIESGTVYLYSLQPLTSTGFHGMLQKSFAGLNDYEYTWLIDPDGVQLCMPDVKVSTFSHVNKDVTFETIGSEFPYVNRSGRANYRTFSITGTISSSFDTNGEFKKRADEKMFGVATLTRDNEAISSMVLAKYKEKRGEDYNHRDGDIYVNYDYEKFYREAVVEMLKNGKPKIFKSDTEGLLKVKLTNVSVSPKEVLGGVICDFSANVIEIGKVDEDTLADFNLAVIE